MTLDAVAAGLVSEVMAAFPRQPPPDWEPGDPFRERVRALLGRWPWDTLPHDVVARVRGDVALLPADVFRYYLPAFVVFLLVDPFGGDVLVDDLLAAMSAPSAAEVEAAGFDPDVVLPALYKEYAARTGAWTETQRAAFLGFLDWLDERHGCDFAPGRIAAARMGICGAPAVDRSDSL